jgi:uncharacterized protein (TIGR03437 family)
VHLASVVALTPSRSAVSTLTKPDGSYVLEGLAPGAYLLYVHPLPPAFANEVRPGNPVNLELPTDPAGAIQPGPGFDTVFWPGTRAPQQSVVVNAGAATSGIDFSVTRRDRVTIFGFQSYSYYAMTAIKPAHVQNRLGRGLALLSGTGLMANRALAPGLTLSLMESAEQIVPGSVRAYSSSPDYYLQMDVSTSPFSTEGVRHLIASSPGETYVLPSAVALVDRGAPSFAVLPYPDGALHLSGAALTTMTRVYFDGVAAAVRLAENGRIVVVPPPAPAGHRAVITALNSDGQSSLFSMSADEARYEYNGVESAYSLSVSPAVLPAGVETVVEITGNGLNLGDAASLKAAFGSSDVVVRRVWAAGTNRLLASVYVAPQAAAAVLPLTVLSGLNAYTAPFALAVTPPAQRQAWVALSVSASAQSVVPGANVTLTIAGLSGTLQSASVSASLNDRPVPIVAMNGNQITIQTPASTALGAAVVRINVNGEAVLPIALAMEAPAPVIREVYSAMLAAVDLNRPARPGETLTIVASYNADPNGSPDPARFKVTTGTVDHQLLSVTPVPQQPGAYQVQFLLSSQTPAGVLSLVLSVDGRPSAVYGLAVAAR